MVGAASVPSNRRFVAPPPAGLRIEPAFSTHFIAWRKPT